MHFIEKEPSQKRIDFDLKLKSNKILRVPGAYNPLTAKLIEEIGYDAVYVSGGVMANDLMDYSIQLKKVVFILIIQQSLRICYCFWNSIIWYSYRL